MSEQLKPESASDGPVHKAFWDDVVKFVMWRELAWLLLNQDRRELMQKHRPVLQGFLDAINAKLGNAGVRIEICADSSRLMVVTPNKDQEVGK